MGLHILWPLTFSLFLWVSVPALAWPLAGIPTFPESRLWEVLYADRCSSPRASHALPPPLPIALQSHHPCELQESWATGQRNFLQAYHSLKFSDFSLKSHKSYILLRKVSKSDYKIIVAVIIIIIPPNLWVNLRAKKMYHHLTHWCLLFPRNPTVTCPPLSKHGLPQAF